jgi:hypothetical protein
MADITMCTGDGCDLKLKCYRHTATSCSWQSWFIEPPIKDGKCDMFWGEKAEDSYNDLKDVFRNNIIKDK